MKSPERQQSSHGKTMTKQLTGKRDDTQLHTAARAGNLELAVEIMSNIGDAELRQLLSKQNNSGETALYVAAENGHVDLVKEMIKYHDAGLAGTKAKNDYDAFHIAAKQGDLGEFLWKLKF
jgi:ankyrin repeat protein